MLDTKQNPSGKLGTPNSSAPTNKTEPAAGKETARDKATRLLSTNPQFKLAPNSGKGYVIPRAEKSTSKDPTTT
jgi:hypothetical protein